MRRDYLWYGIALCWAISATIGILKHHTQQAIPAVLFAIVFALFGVVIGRRDKPLRQRRLAAQAKSTPKSNSEPA